MPLKLIRISGLEMVLLAAPLYLLKQDLMRIKAG